MQNGIYSEEITTSTHIDPNFAVAYDLNELEAFNRAKVNYSCEDVEVDFILRDRHKCYGGRSDCNEQNGNQVNLCIPALKVCCYRGT